jgi:hypothetical protein
MPDDIGESFNVDHWATDYGPALYKGRIRLEFTGCVVNPKTLKPYFVYARIKMKVTGVIGVPTSGREIVLMGNGYLEDSAESSYAVPAEHFGLPRVHTPAGVAIKGEGLGTCLYVGMAVVATYANELIDPSSWEVGVAHPGNGICSGYGASDEAIAWWDRAVDSGLAREETFKTGGTPPRTKGYAMTFGTAVRKRLVLDGAPGIVGVFDEARPDIEALAGIIVNLDLSEIVDPKVLEYFYALAFNYGAKFEEVVKMRNRAEGPRRGQGVLDRAANSRRGVKAFVDEDSNLEEIMEGADVWTHPEEDLMRRLRARPITVSNPPPDYEEIAADLYPEFIGMDD